MVVQDLESSGEGLVDSSTRLPVPLTYAIGPVEGRLSLQDTCANDNSLLFLFVSPDMRDANSGKRVCHGRLPLSTSRHLMIESDVSAVNVCMKPVTSGC